MPFKFNPFTSKFDYYKKPVPPVISEESIRFFDDFDDGSIFWGWRQFPGSGSFSEAGSTLTIHVAFNDIAAWSTTSHTAARLDIGYLGCPFIIEVLLNSFTVNNDNYAGIFLSSDVDYDSGGYTYLFGRGRLDAEAVNGLASRTQDSWITTNSITTMPIYLRIKINSLTLRGQIIVEYSTDGSSWSNFETYDLANLFSDYQEGFTVGLFGINDLGSGVFEVLDAPFDYFIMQRSFGP